MAVTGRWRRTAIAGGSAGAKTKMMMTEAAVEATMAMDGATAMRRRRDSNYNAMVTGRWRRTAVAGGSAGAQTKTTMTEAAVEATAIAGRVDTLATTTVTTGTIVTATTMTRLNVCDASTEEKEHPSNLSRMHATIK